MASGRTSRTFGENFSENGHVKSKFEVVQTNPLKVDKCTALVPKWVVGVAGIFGFLILIFLSATLGVLYTAPRPSLYGESCDRRSCLQGIDLVCINNTCTCKSNQYFATKCLNKKTINESCSKTIPCKENTNLVCRDGVCKCNSTHYWDGQQCTLRRAYKQTCNSTEECVKNQMLVCDSNTKTCICENTRYWDNSECMLKRTINETCTTQNECIPSQYLSCLYGLCKCGTGYYWEIIYKMCMTPVGENKTCAGTYQCYTPMTCNNTECKCSAFQYHNQTSLTCINQKSINLTCSVDYNCRVDKGLTCQSGKCQCYTDIPIWSTTLNKCIPRYKYGETGCTLDNHCELGKSLICYGGSSSLCTCPTNTVNGMCDCYRTYGDEWYWDGTVCTAAISYGGSCQNAATSYMCQTLTQGTVCNITSGSSYICHCPPLQYLNTTQNKCLNQNTNGQTCSSNIGCRTDLGLSCQSGVCKCDSTYQYWSTTLYKCVNYQTYADLCTSNGGECDPRLNLFCNSGTTCDCPSTSSINKCDCVRVSGNEFYWNTSSCTAALTNGASCQSASTSYMCQTLTQGTVCNITGTSYYCQCPSLQYFNTAQGKCLPQETVLGTCSVNIGCRIDLGLSCQSTVCKCNSTYQYWSTTLYKCLNYQTYTDACTSSGGECDPRLKLICNAGSSCDCPTTSLVNKCDCVRVSGNEFYWNTTSCTAALTNGTSCQSASTSYMCQTLTQGTVCNITGTNFYCQCPSLKYFNTAQSKCLPQETNLGTCSVNIGCRIDLGLSCVSTVCKCNSTYQFWSTTLFKCVNYKTYAESCNPDQCDPRTSLTCNSGTSNNCTCPTYLTGNKCDCTRAKGNENYWNGSSCVPCVSYGSKCVTGETYECQTLAVVGVDCDSGICQCPGNSGLQNSTMKCISCATNWKFVDPNCYRLGDNVDKSDKNAHNGDIDKSCGKSALVDPQKGTCQLAKLNLPGVVSYFNSIAAGKELWVDLSGDGKTSYDSVDTTWTVSVSDPEWGGTNSKSTKDACVYYTVSSSLFYEEGCNNVHNHACQYTP